MGARIPPSLHRLGLFRDRRIGSKLPRLQDFVYEEQVGEQGAQMDRSVQVIDQLGTERGLGENELDGGERVAGVAFQQREKREVGSGGLKVFLLYGRCVGLRQT